MSYCSGLLQKACQSVPYLARNRHEFLACEPCFAISVLPLGRLAEGGNDRRAGVWRAEVHVPPVVAPSRGVERVLDRRTAGLVHPDVQDEFAHGQRVAAEYTTT